MSIVEQRKVILEDGHGKSLEQIQEFLQASGFNLKRGYLTLRGQKALVFVQDVDEGSPATARTVDSPFFGKVELPTKQKLEELRDVPAKHFLDSILDLLHKKLKDNKPLTPIEGLLAAMFAQGLPEMDRLRGMSDV
jgi:hypothetical protein